MKKWLMLLGMAVGMIKEAHGFAVRFCSESPSDTLVVRYYNTRGTEQIKVLRPGEFFGEIYHLDVWGREVKYYSCEIVHLETGALRTCFIGNRDAILVVNKNGTLEIYRNTQYDTGSEDCVCSNSPCVDERFLEYVV